KRTRRRSPFTCPRQPVARSARARGPRRPRDVAEHRARRPQRRQPTAPGAHELRRRLTPNANERGPKAPLVLAWRRSTALGQAHVAEDRDEAADGLVAC